VIPEASDAGAAADPRAEEAPRHRDGSVLTHGLALGLSAAGVAVLLVLAALRGKPKLVTACSIYGATLVFLYLASTLYHGLDGTRARHVLRIIDHASIYLLIAGTYTPVAVVVLGGAWGWCLFGVIWALAALGVVLKALFMGRFRILSVLVYLGMGWLSLVVLDPLLSRLGPQAIAWFVAGGLLYTGGLLFFAWKSLPYGHAVWHLFVMGGSALHFLAILCYVLPLA